MVNEIKLPKRIEDVQLKMDKYLKFLFEAKKREEAIRKKFSPQWLEKVLKGTANTIVKGVVDGLRGSSPVSALTTKEEIPQLSAGDKPISIQPLTQRSSGTEQKTSDDKTTPFTTLIFDDKESKLMVSLLKKIEKNTDPSAKDLDYINRGEEPIEGEKKSGGIFGLIKSFGGLLAGMFPILGGLTKTLFSLGSSLLNFAKLIPDAISVLGRFITSIPLVGPAIVAAIPVLVVAATAAALGGFLGKLWQDWRDRREAENDAAETEKFQKEKFDAKTLEFNALTGTAEKNYKEHEVLKREQMGQKFTLEEAAKIKETLGVQIKADSISQESIVTPEAKKEVEAIRQAEATQAAAIVDTRNKVQLSNSVEYKKWRKDKGAWTEGMGALDDSDEYSVAAYIKETGIQIPEVSSVAPVTPAPKTTDLPSNVSPAAQSKSGANLATVNATTAQIDAAKASKAAPNITAVQGGNNTVVNSSNNVISNISPINYDPTLRYISPQG